MAHNVKGTVRSFAATPLSASFSTVRPSAILLEIPSVCRSRCASSSLSVHGRWRERSHVPRGEPRNPVCTLPRVRCASLLSSLPLISVLMRAVHDLVQSYLRFWGRHFPGPGNLCSLGGFLGLEFSLTKVWSALHRAKPFWGARVCGKTGGGAELLPLIVFSKHQLPSRISFPDHFLTGFCQLHSQARLCVLSFSFTQVLDFARVTVTLIA